MTDVDGTISETAPTPQQAVVSPLCRQYLYTLSQRLDLVAAISGRPATEVKDMIKIDSMVYIGNHGLERWADGNLELARDVTTYPEIIKAVTEELTRLLSIEGIMIENKGATATIHYRLCPEPETARRYILAALENSIQAKSLRILPGRMSINLLPPVEASKGTAVSSLIQGYNLRGGIYLGDDFTDIDAFRAIHAASRDSDFHGFAIGITSQEMPERLLAEIDFTLNGIGDVERFLEWLSRTALQAN
jgi:trehalose 6-phosphate phosphatase